MGQINDWRHTLLPCVVVVLPFFVLIVAEPDLGTSATGEVYGPTTGPELRLITCGGAFDRAAGSYLDNVVVWAVRPRPTA